MNRRTGITLTEVMVTMFVMAIGLLALLTLFPLAALNMAQAIQDDRVAHAAANAEALANMYWDFLPANDLTAAQSAQQGLAAINHTGSLFLNSGGTQPANDSPSWPLYIDPVGYNQAVGLGGNQDWVGGITNAVRRLETPWINWNNAFDKKIWRMQNFVLPDDIIFDKNGVPYGAPSLRQLQREGRYSWAYLVRRPRTASGGIVEMQIVIYAQRPLYTTDRFAGEVATTGIGTAGNNFIDIQMPAQPVTLRKGIWIMDVSQDRLGSTDARKFGPVHAHFYRVQNVILVNSSTRRLELQSPLKGNVQRVVFMEYVVEVFDKGAGWHMPYMSQSDNFSIAP